MNNTLISLCLVGTTALASASVAAAERRAAAPGEPFTSEVSVSFANASTAFRPNAAAISTLQLAPHAAMVTVNGRTSTNRPSSSDEWLALRRALAARAWLVAHGVPSLKIMVNFASAADFLVDNSTPEGRYINQRVDIEMFFVP